MNHAVVGDNIWRNAFPDHIRKDLGSLVNVLVFAKTINDCVIYYYVRLTTSNLLHIF
ncbi:hypothetical protein LguiA_029201 [Lonicera macranthoides]